MQEAANTVLCSHSVETTRVHSLVRNGSRPMILLSHKCYKYFYLLIDLYNVGQLCHVGQRPSVCVGICGGLVSLLAE